MVDELVSFKTAKLAKEKGFDGEFYGEHLHLNQNRWFTRDGVECYYTFDEYIDDLDHFNETIHFLIPRPTQSLLKRWLRQVHKIHIEPQLSRNKNEEYKDWWFYLYPKLSGGRIKFYPSEIGEGLSYEQALEEGLQEALILIN